MRRKSQRGATSVEMALVGIPILFTLVSIFEISRGMWVYHTMAAAIREGVRYATVHGVNCATAPNTCGVTAQQVAAQIKNFGVGLDLTNTHLTFISGGAKDVTDVTLADCVAGTGGACTAAWPVTNATNTIIEIDGIVRFNSALAMFWPGSKVISFGQVWFPAQSSDVIQF